MAASPALAAALPALLLPSPRRGFVIGICPTVQLQLPQTSKEHFKGRVEGSQVPLVLDQSCSERSFERPTLRQFGVVKRVDSVNGFYKRDGDTCRSQLLHELGEDVKGIGGGGVAGDHQELDTMVHEPARGVEGVSADGGRGLGAVGKAGGVSEVEVVLARHPLAQGLENREPADAGVEDPDLTHDRAIKRLLRTNGFDRSRWPVRVVTSCPPKRIWTAETSGQLRMIELTTP